MPENFKEALLKKRYYSFDLFLKEYFNEKIYKLCLNAGLTCPNRDGTLGTRGCIFCSAGGSGDFAQNPNLTITNQIENAKLLVKDKFNGKRYIAYFQAYTNTYGPIDYLRRIYTEAAANECIAALSIATRPDCISDEVLSLLCEINSIKPVFVELGLQTIHEASALFIRRGYSLNIFYEMVQKLSDAGLMSVIHIILGLPNEKLNDIFETIDYVCSLPIHGIKLQLLHILKGTDLYDYYLANKDNFHMLEFDTYIDCVVRALERIPKHIIIHRLTGDGPKELLAAPLWSADKKRVLNAITHELKLRNTFQGRTMKNATGNTYAIQTYNFIHS